MLWRFAGCDSGAAAPYKENFSIKSFLSTKDSPMDTSIGLKTAKNKKSSPEQINALLEKIGRNSDSSAVDLDELIGKGDALEALLAKHPNTNAQTLENLSLSTSRLTCKNIVLNPNTPKDVLLNLAPRFPGDFFKNPMFDWFFLEDPDLFTKLEKGVLKNILKRGECPESFLRWAAKNGDFQERLAATMNPKAPNDLLALLAEQDDSIGILAKAMVEIKPELLINLRDSKYC